MTDTGSFREGSPFRRTIRGRITSDEHKAVPFRKDQNVVWTSVADMSGGDTTDLGRLYEAIGTDALDRVFDDERNTEHEIHRSLTDNGCEVLISTSGRIEIPNPTDQETG